ncbi:MAG: TGS domain-containing protein, partial [Calditerrivibrio sp.]|nr:TGS domain-containing protein [Calditerrivibrio sp.]
MNVVLPDKSKIELVDGSTVADLAKKISEGLYKRAIAAKVNGNIVDLSYKLNENDEVTILTDKD